MKTIATLAAAMLVAGCATGTNGVVTIGENLYMIGGLGSATDFSGSAVKARYFGQASEFCSKQGKAMQPVNSTGQDSGVGTYASAEVQFRCVAKPVS